MNNVEASAENSGEKEPLHTQGNTQPAKEGTADIPALFAGETPEDGSDNRQAENNLNNIADADDLHEIQVGDDLNEPDLDEYLPEADNNIDKTPRQDNP